MVEISTYKNGKMKALVASRWYLVRWNEKGVYFVRIRGQDMKIHADVVKYLKSAK